jgi:RNA polymerase sigma-70 factor (ECF subfamily)
MDEAAPADIESEMIRTERGERVKVALEKHTERDREVLLLWDAGMSYTEIAAETGLAAGAVGTTLARARKRLVDLYEKTGRGNVARG